MYFESNALCQEWTFSISEEFVDSFEIFLISPPEVFLGKVFCKDTANLQEKTHAEVWFQ